METCISIIIPVYNCEQYLSRCLDSVLNQTYKELEIILINDGSTDYSADICKKYAAKDKRIKYVEQENHGVAYTRKRAVQLATGRYVGFVDADDYIDEDMYEKMFFYMKNAQLVTSGFYNQGKKIFDVLPAGLYHSEGEMSFFYSNMLMFKNERGILTNLWNKLFVTQLLKRVVKDTSMEVYNGEDVDILFRYTLICDSVYVSRLCAYHYNISNDNSISNSEDKNYLKNVNSLYLSLEKEFKRSKYRDILLPKWDQWIWQTVVLLAPRFMGLSLQRENEDNKIIRYLNPYTNLLKGKKIILYGAGRVGKDYYRLNCKAQDFCLDMWVDSDWERLQKENYNVQSVDQVLSVEYDYVLIAVKNQEKAEEIRTQLQGKGIDNSKIIWKTPIELYD